MAEQLMTQASGVLTNSSWTDALLYTSTDAGSNASLYTSTEAGMDAFNGSEGGLFDGAASPSKALNAPYIMVAMVILVGNLLVIITILKRIDLQTQSNLYVFNLAVTDLLVGIALLLKVAETYHPNSFHSLLLCTGLRIGTFVHSQMLSIFLMAGIAVDRFMAINDPYGYQQKVTRTKTIAMIAVIWVYCFCISYLPSLLGYHNWKPSSPTCVLAQTFTKPVVYNLLANYYLATTMIYVTYAALFKIAARHAKEIAKLAPEIRGQEEVRLKKNFKAAKTLLIVMGTFTLCWLPYTTNLLYLVATDTTDRNSLPWKIQNVLVASLVVNSAVNPVIYARRLPGFKTEFLRILTCYQYNRMGQNAVAAQSGSGSC